MKKQIQKLNNANHYNKLILREIKYLIIFTNTIANLKNLIMKLIY